MRTHRPTIGPLRACLLVAVAALLLLPVTGAAQDDDPQTVTVKFSELNDSGVRGTATFTAKGDDTLVELDVAGAEGNHPDHIHRSTCDDPEPNPLFPLTDVVLDRADEMGHSETTVEVPLSELLDEPHVILIHKSVEEIDEYIACTDIIAAGGQATNIPRTGVGFGERDGPLLGSMEVLLLLAAAGLATVALRLGRAPRV